MSGFIIHVSGDSHVGMERETQEDAYRITRGRLFIVCDGMGGHNAGDVASNMGADTTVERMGQDVEFLDLAGGARLLTGAIQDADKRILEISQGDGPCAGMATTITAALVCGMDLLFANAGDSRGYVLREHRLVQMTRDHSFVQDQIDCGLMTERQARRSEDRGIITNFLGGLTPLTSIDLTIVSLRRGDVALLCSDGLTEILELWEIREILIANKNDPEKAVRILIQRANAAGGYDNITAIVIVFDGDDLDLPTDKDVFTLKRVEYVLS